MSTKVTIKNNGSIQVDGEFDLCDQAGNKFDLSTKKTIWLCRCGSSKNKPFCDGSHKVSGFQSDIKAK
jgi:CDGSH-type Zn-finger protein